MISRRGFFGMLAGLAAAPALAPVMKFFPDARQAARVYYTKEMIANLKKQTELGSLFRSRGPIPYHEGKQINFFTYKLSE